MMTLISNVYVVLLNYDVLRVFASVEAAVTFIGRREALRTPIDYDEVTYHEDEQQKLWCWSNYTIIETSYERPARPGKLLTLEPPSPPPPSR